MHFNTVLELFLLTVLIFKSAFHPSSSIFHCTLTRLNDLKRPLVLLDSVQLSQE